MAGRFSAATLARFDATKYLYIRSGSHRFTPIWVVVVDSRVIVRSWSDKATGWYRALLRQPACEVRIRDEELPARAVRVRSGKLNDGADAAYAFKYTTKANAKYVKGFKSPRRKAATLELIPG